MAAYIVSLNYGGMPRVTEQWRGDAANEAEARAKAEAAIPGYKAYFAEVK